MGKGKKDYSKSLIYKLCCNDTNIKQIYIGSTTNFRVRKNKHKSECNNKNGLSYNEKKYVFIRENGGWKKWDMVLVEYYNATDIIDLKRRERYWYDLLNSTLNSFKPYITQEEKKEYYKEYYVNNKEKYIEQSKINYEKNKEKICNIKKEYYEKNKERIKESHREKYKCHICNKELTIGNKARHEKSKYHLKFINA